MKDLPEIAPELRGLLEEIVADPRSAIRLAPRRALRSWFDRGEAARAHDVSTTRAEQHLVEAHREALAEMLLEAAIIAYWKAPASYSIRPITQDGNPFDVDASERRWRRHASAQLRSSSEGSDDLQLLRSCLEGTSAVRGLALASASLNLVPRDRTRLCVACHAAKERPRWALVVAQHAATHAYSPSVRGLARAKAAALLTSLGRMDEAWSGYQGCAEDLPIAWFSIFNLACFTRQKNEALEASTELARHFEVDSSFVSDAEGMLRSWARTRPLEEIRGAKETLSLLGDRISATARKVGLAYG